MSMQPSAQGIASLYMGNPGALQQKIKKDEQAKPGMPPDLQKLMALNIVTNEQDAAKRQQALNALNSMAPAGGQPPTVAQSIQEQAKQKLQAQMLQQQRQQQGLAALAKQQPGQEVPEGTQFAQAQPSGIDDLPVDMEFAGGGIVAFSGGKDVTYETPYDRMTRENREQAERERAERLARIEAAGGNTTSYGEQMRGLGQFIDRFVPDPVRMFRRLVSDPALEREDAAAAAAKAAQQDNRAALNRADAGLRAAAPDATPAPRREMPPSAPRAATPAKPTAPATAPAAQAPSQDPRQKLLSDALNAQPDTAQAAAIARAREMYGAPDTSQYDRLVAELEGRRKQFNAPEPGFGAFMELMQQIAAQGPQRTSAEAGARGAAGLAALNKERQAQQFELTKQMVDVAQKKLDADRGYRKELFGLGEKERDEVEKRSMEAAKEFGQDARNTAILANQITVAKIQAAASAARLAGAETLNANQRMQLADKAADNVTAMVKNNMQLSMQIAKNPGLLSDMITQETARLLAAAEGRTMQRAPGAPSPGGTMSGWGKASVVNP